MKKRTLKAKWTVELQNDMVAYYPLFSEEYYWNL